jgi:RimJ/RimL family protein N-acetyltransferase
MSQIPAFTVALKDGRTATVRTATTADGAATLANRVATTQETRFVLPTPEDVAGERAEDQEAIIADCLTRDDALFLVAESNGALIGTCMTRVEMPHRTRKRHEATLGIALLAAWHGVGLGRAMIAATIAWCRTHPVIERIALSTMAGNVPGIGLYASLGFEHEGRRRNAVRHGPADYDDLVWMGLDVRSEAA